MGVLALEEITVSRQNKAGRLEALFKAMPCATSWQRFRGLMFSKKKNLLFVFDDKRIRGFHMFFVFFPIDIIFLDPAKQIVEVKENFLPFTFYTPKKAFRYAVEVKKGVVKKRNLIKGDTLVLKSMEAPPAEKLIRDLRVLAQKAKKKLQAREITETDLQAK